MSRGRLLVLGTGNAQADFIAFCKEYGYEVFACSNSVDGRGSKIADHFELIDITDVKKIKDFVLKHNIQFIYSTGSDIAMPTVAIVSRDVGLSCFITPETAISCNDKSILREKLKDIPEFTVSSVLIEDENDLSKWCIFPAIVKPVDSQGQRGITKVESFSQLNQAYINALKHSRSKRAIIEEFIDGSEVSVNIYVINGIIKYMFVSDRVSFSEFPGGIIKKHSYPSKCKVNHELLNRLLFEVIKVVGLNNGPGYFQIMVDTRGNPKVIEVTPRLDGCHLWRLINIVDGFNIFEILLNHLQGNLNLKFDFQYELLNKYENVELIFFTSPPDLLFKRENFTEHSALYTEWYYQDGERIRPINLHAEKVGYQIISF